MDERTAACACGALTATCRGEPARISVCHCLDCKRRTGSAFSYNVTYSEAQVAVQGESGSYRRDSDDGFWGEHHFCPRCGVSVFCRIERRPEMISIPVGAFADPSFPEPMVSVYTERQHSWLRIETDPPVEEVY
jgi:hypothetical protein